MSEWVLHNARNNDDEMHNNAICVYDRLGSMGWTLEAIAGILGNMQAESSIQPWAIQGYRDNTTEPPQYWNTWDLETKEKWLEDNDIEIPYRIGGYKGDWFIQTQPPKTPANQGYGLIQWTNSKATSISQNPLYAYTNGDWTNADRQIEFINGADAASWLPRQGYKITYEEFKHSTLSYLASAYLRNRERPANYNSETARRNQARYWYEFLKGSGHLPEYDPGAGGENQGTPSPPIVTIWIWILFSRVKRGFKGVKIR